MKLSISYQEDKTGSGINRTVGKSGSNHIALMYNLLSNVGNQSRGAVLAEPFPWTVTQGVTHVFIIINSQL
jgi:hypothetical protein